MPPQPLPTKATNDIVVGPVIPTTPFLLTLPDNILTRSIGKVDESPGNYRHAMIHWPSTHESMPTEQIIFQRYKLMERLSECSQIPEIAASLPEFTSANQACRHMWSMHGRLMDLTARRGWVDGAEYEVKSPGGEHYTTHYLVTQYAGGYLSQLVDACSTHMLQQSKNTLSRGKTVTDAVNISKGLLHFKEHLNRVQDISMKIIEAFQEGDRDKVHRVVERMRTANPVFHKSPPLAQPFPWRAALFRDKISYDKRKNQQPPTRHLAEPQANAQLDPTIQDLLNSIILPIGTFVAPYQEEEYKSTELDEKEGEEDGEEEEEEEEEGDSVINDNNSLDEALSVLALVQAIPVDPVVVHIPHNTATQAEHIPTTTKPRHSKHRTPRFRVQVALAITNEVVKPSVLGPETRKRTLAREQAEYELKEIGIETRAMKRARKSMELARFGLERTFGPDKP